MKSSLPSPVATEVERQIGGAIRQFVPAAGGCINHGGTCILSDGAFFLKWNDRLKYPGMFAKEAAGLSLLAHGTSLHVPAVIHHGEAASFQFLLLTNIVEAKRAATYWRDFGTGLAQLHRMSADTYGLDHDNYIGSLRQRNTQGSSWIEFFAQQRLREQLKLAYDEGRIERRLLKKFDLLIGKLGTLLVEEPPSLLHGDLWGGNIMTNSNGQPVLIDPAVYFGHREVDLAMTSLFGGFNRVFLDHYDDTFPLLPGYEDRFDLYNLYPLLVHVNLFGGGYVNQVSDVVSRFV